MWKFQILDGLSFRNKMIIQFEKMKNKYKQNQSFSIFQITTFSN